MVMTNLTTAAADVITLLSGAAHCIACEHGFYADYNHAACSLDRDGHQDISDAMQRDFTLAQIAKIASECGEAVSAIQHGEPTSALLEELADIVIRTFDLAAWLSDKDYQSDPFGKIVIDKMRKNNDRPYKHGKVC